MLTVTELFVGLFTGRPGEAWASLRALVGLVPRTPSTLARRRAVARVRRVDDHDILRLQNRGSARLTRYRRARDTETYVGESATVRRWRESPLSTTIAWAVVLLFIVLASRSMINRKVPTVGEFLPQPASPRQWWSDFTSAWNPGGLGATVANPTGWGVLSIASVLWLWHQGLGLTVLVVGLVIVGVWGAWRLGTVFPANRARITALVVYAAVPLVPGVMSTGRLTALVGYAAVPWFVQLLRMAVGIGTADPRAAAADLVDGVIQLRPRERVRRTAMLAIAAALAIAVAPAVLPILVLVTIVLALTSLAAGAGLRTTGWMAGLGLAGCAAAWILNLPWSTTWSWDDLVAPSLAGAPGRGLADVASMAIGRGRFELLSLALYVPVLIALLVGRAWRLTWAARAAGLVVVFLLLAVLQDRDSLPVRVPDVGLLLVPVGLGMAISAASALAAFGEDVAERTFGWRQPFGLLGVGAVVLGVAPALFTLSDGAWYAPRASVSEAIEAPLPTASSVGDYRVLYVGDPRLIPFPSADLGDGVAMAVVDDDRSDLRDRWAVADQSAVDSLRDAVRQIADGATRRGGRLLAPFGIRFVVVPLIDGAASTTANRLPVPAGLVEALQSQLDLVRPPAPPSYVRFDNESAMPVVAQLAGPLADASKATSVETLAGVDTSTATAAFPQVDQSRSATGDATAGVVNMATPHEPQWELSVGGAAVASRPSFGVATAYDVAAAGPAELRYAQPASRTLWLVVLALLWVAVLVAASRATIPARLRTRRAGEAALIDLDAEAGAAMPVAERTGFGGWVDDLFPDDVEPDPTSGPARSADAPVGPPEEPS